MYLNNILLEFNKNVMNVGHILIFSAVVIKYILRQQAPRIL